jgi:hypothetical protein
MSSAEEVGFALRLGSTGEGTPHRRCGAPSPMAPPDFYEAHIAKTV